MISTQHSKKIPAETQLPNLLLIGSAKSGTSSLAYMVGQHPDLHFSDPKEPNVLFATDSVDEVHQLYKKLFPAGGRATVRAEGSTAYTVPDLGERSANMAARALGDQLKIIALLRDPVQRLESHLRHDLIAGRLTEDDVSTAIRENPIYIGTSRYPERLEPWIKHFGLDQVLVLSFEEFKENPGVVFHRICDFCGIARTPVSTLDTRNTNPSSNRLSLNGLWLPISRSVLYRRHIRPHLPRSVINRAVKSVAKTSEGSRFRLADSDLVWVEEQLENVRDELRELLNDPTFSLGRHHSAPVMDPDTSQTSLEERTPRE